MAPLLNTLQTNETLRSAARFVVVGILGTLIDIALFTVLRFQFSIPTLPANTLSYCAGIMNNYFFHRNWTYRQRSQKAAGKQFSQFVGVSLSALIINNLIVSLLAPAFSAIFADPGQGAVLAKLCAIAVGVSWNFLANHLWTFRAAQYR